MHEAQQAFEKIYGTEPMGVAKDDQADHFGTATVTLHLCKMADGVLL